MFALILSGAVVQIAASQFPVNPALTWVDISAVSPSPAVGWTYAGGVFAAPPAPPPPPPVTQFTPLQFMARFTTAEQLAITAAGQASSPIMLWLLHAMGASYIDLADPATTTGVQALVAAALISAGRATEILTP